MKFSIHKILVVALLIMVLLIPTTVFASESMNIKNASFAAGDATINNDQIDGDYYIASSTFTNSGNIKGDLIGVGNTSTIGSEIGGNLRYAGSNITINSIIQKNVTLAVANGEFTTNSVVNGSVIAFGSNLNFNGAVMGDVLANGAVVTINGIINGNLNVNASTLIINKDAVINGNITCTVENEPKIEQGATIGNITKNLVSDLKKEKPAIPKKTFTPFGIVRLIGNIGMLLLFAFLMYRFLPKKYEQQIKAVSKRPFMSLLVGFTAISLILGVCLIIGLLFLLSAFIFTPAIPLMVIVVAVAIYSLIFFLSIIPIAAWLGKLIFKGGSNKYLTILVGLSIIKLVQYLLTEFAKITGHWSFGVVSFIISLAILCIGSGAIIMTTFKSESAANDLAIEEIKEIDTLGE